MKTVSSAGVIHLPAKGRYYPFELIEWPLCGLVQEDIIPAWSDKAANCERCKKVAKIKAETDKLRPPEQLRLDL